MMLRAKLDFDRESLMDPEFKKPQSRKRPLSERSNLDADDEGSFLQSSIEASSLAAPVSDTINVFLRLKPVPDIPIAYEFTDDLATLKTEQHNRNYRFTRVLNQLTDNITCYNICIRPIIANPFESSGAAFASYGVSNSGKTYTILGEQSAAGVVPRALVQIFSEFDKSIAEFPIVKVDKEKIHVHNDSEVIQELTAVQNILFECKGKQKINFNWSKSDIQEEHQFEPGEKPRKIYVWISFVEIYMEKIVDLFASTKTVRSTSSLRVISNDGNPYILGASWLYVATVENALELLKYGLRRANYAETGCNAHSSRSHTIFSINLISESDQNYEFSSFKFCDLAGAERVSKTGNNGERLKEAGGINTSLSVLGKCLNAVSQNQKNDGKKNLVPVRESKLTHLLQSSLEGRQKFVMIVNLLPTIESFDENINVLQFGSIANKIAVRKTEVKKFARLSFSMFMQGVCNSPKLNSSLMIDDTIPEGDESELDFSFSLNRMSVDELRHQLRNKTFECELLTEKIREKENEIIDKEQMLRNQIAQTVRSRVESEKQFHKEDVNRIEHYYQQKLESKDRKYDRLVQEYDYLENENARLKKKLGIPVDEIVELIDSDEEDSDVEADDGNDDEMENIEPVDTKE